MQVHIFNIYRYVSAGVVIVTPQRKIYQEDH